MSVPLNSGQNHNMDDITKNAAQGFNDVTDPEELSSFFTFPSVINSGFNGREKESKITSTFNFCKDLQNTESKTRPFTVNQAFKNESN